MRSNLGLRVLRLIGASTLVCASFVPAITRILPAHGTTLVPLSGPAGPLRPPAAALQPHGVHGTGSRVMGLRRAAHPPSHAQLATHSTVSLAAIPASADLSQYNPPVGNQGQVSSCAAWATGYYLRGWYAMRDGYYPPAGNGRGDGFAPMFLYTRSSGGVDQGSSIEDNLSIMEQGASGGTGWGQGIDTRADYAQGDFDYKDLPTAAEIANAGLYTLGSYSVYSPASTGLNLADWIKSSIAAGNPIVLGMPVYPAFYNATSSSYLVGAPAPGTGVMGYHAVFADKYDANGVWIENQWGTWWGLNGWVEVGWDFINYLYTTSSVWYDAASAGSLPFVAGTPTNTGTPTKTGTLTRTSTPTRTPTRTPTNTPTITNTRTVTNTPTVTNTRTVTNTPTVTYTRTETRTPTNTPTITNTRTPSNTPTITNTRTATNTPTITNTRTETRTPTNTPTITNTRTPTNTPTITNTRTATNTATATRTPTNTPTLTATATP